MLKRKKTIRLLKKIVPKNKTIDGSEELGERRPVMADGSQAAGAEASRPRRRHVSVTGARRRPDAWPHAT